ncbi:MAG TPA: hypothetical protein VEC17_01975 [Candidatus Binatia bacterium]|nr:hypothetical protein [Candidatus Binatia bacterium]
MTEQILLVLGIVLVVCGVSAWMNATHFRRVLGDFKDNPALIFFLGLINLAVGLFIVLNHNSWATPAESLVTFFGWAGMLRGLIMTVTPGIFLSLFKFIWLGRHLKGESLFMLAIGAILIYLSL